MAEKDYIDEMQEEHWGAITLITFDKAQALGGNLPKRLAY